MKPKAIHKLLVTGSTGLVGSRFLQLSKEIFEITTIGRENVDLILNLLSEKEVGEIISSSDADAVINFAAFTNVDGAEKEKGNKQSIVFILNSNLPLWIAKACQKSDKLFFHISTDYVFNGVQESRPYTEEDRPQPVNSWYAQTKFFGEENILNIDSNKNHCAIIRISYPYSGVYERKLDIARTVVEKIKNGDDYFGIYDQKIKPTSVDDISMALTFLINKKATGIYHIAGNFNPKDYITPYEFAQNIAEILDLGKGMIRPISFIERSKKRIAPRPQHTWLSTKKIESLGFKITNMKASLARFKNQLQYTNKE